MASLDRVEPGRDPRQAGPLSDHALLDLLPLAPQDTADPLDRHVLGQQAADLTQREAEVLEDDVLTGLSLENSPMLYTATSES